jgi:hypothetical protein
MASDRNSVEKARQHKRLAHATNGVVIVIRGTHYLRGCRLAGVKRSECRHSFYASHQWRDCRSIRSLDLRKEVKYELAKRNAH